MARLIAVAHDFTCPWCWIAVSQARRLRREFDVEFDWLGFEMWPEELGWLAPKPREEPDPRRSPVPSRLDLAYAAEGLTPPTSLRPMRMRTHLALEAVEHAKTLGLGEAVAERLYEAYWLDGAKIGEPEVLREVCAPLIPDVDAMLTAISERRYASQIVGFDDPAHEVGVFNVPTFFIDGKPYAEQPYEVLREAVRVWVDRTEAPESAYGRLEFPAAPPSRPYVFANMVATIDGKSVSGERTEPVGDLGSAVDHATMRQIESAADAVMVGAGALRAVPGMFFGPRLKRFVVTRSGQLDRSAKFFVEATNKAFVVTLRSYANNGENTIAEGEGDVDFPRVLARMRWEFGIERLLVEGGSELNAALLAADLVDELFVTVAPKVKLGRQVPTLAGGEPLDRRALLGFSLVSSRTIGDEVFLRYRRKRD